MTEEKNRLMLHGHLMVWVHGFTSLEQLRNDIGHSLKKHAELANLHTYVNMFYVHPGVSLEEVEFGLFNASEPVYDKVVLPSASPFNESTAQQN
ncbi:unnamed protein product, partial [Ectocarpus sp. 4 AP-2014]